MKFAVLSVMKRGAKVENKIFLKRVGRSIIIIRKSINLKQEDLAELCGVNQNYISDIENGKRNITMIKLFDIAEALNVDVEVIFQQTKSRNV